MSSYSDRKKKKELKYRFSLVLLFIAASFIVCFVLYMKEEAPPEITDPNPAETVILNETGGTPAGIGGYDTDNPVGECLKLDISYLDRCMFAGDSLMVELGSYGFVPESRVAAGVGMSVMDIGSKPLTEADGSEILAADKINSQSPENLYILLGLNMMESFTDDQLLAAYGDFVNSIDRSATEIYVISVPPVTREREQDSDRPILNSDIDSFNADLLKFADDRGLNFLDFNSAVKDEEGFLMPEYAETDGIHFKKNAYEVFIEYILTHVRF
ncbi:MAG: hypothetical protein NC078_07425 [Ruminococcus sp.]|nr:hypothetical protein [Ruminococcus sp.]